MSYTLPLAKTQMFRFVHNQRWKNCRGFVIVGLQIPETKAGCEIWELQFQIAVLSTSAHNGKPKQVVLCWILACAVQIHPHKQTIG